MNKKLFLTIVGITLLLVGLVSVTSVSQHVYSQATEKKILRLGYFPKSFKYLGKYRNLSIFFSALVSIHAVRQRVLETSPTRSRVVQLLLKTTFC